MQSFPKLFIQSNANSKSFEVSPVVTAKPNGWKSYFFQFCQILVLQKQFIGCISLNMTAEGFAAYVSSRFVDYLHDLARQWCKCTSSSKLVKLRSFCQFARRANCSLIRTLAFLQSDLWVCSARVRAYEQNKGCIVSELILPGTSIVKVTIGL